MSDENKAAVKSADKSKDKGSWFKGLKAEFNKIVWESRDNVTKQTIAVVVVSLVLGVIIAILDLILQYGVDFIVGL
ncbi:MAG: preprotein translocase subunit SecE [Lachnospiraceae bacterium]|nr:preprotein translocase subunit SecE [Lachnospiraceae bacterium]